MNASSRIKVDNELRAEPDSLRCCTRITGEDSRIFAFFCGSIIAAAGLLLSTAKALSMPMPGALDDGSFSIQGCKYKPWIPDPERKRDPCHGREPLPGTPAVLPDGSKRQGVAKV
jgi:hypothetical protein